MLDSPSANSAVDEPVPRMIPLKGKTLKDRLPSFALSSRAPPRAASSVYAEMRPLAMNDQAEPFSEQCLHHQAEPILIGIPLRCCDDVEPN